MEETGLAVSLERFVGLYSSPTRDPRGVVVALFECRVIGGQVTAQSDASEAGWFSLNGLPELAGNRAEMIRDALVLMCSPSASDV